jgi:hypothetical protein
VAFVAVKHCEFELATLTAIDPDNLAYAPNTIGIEAQMNNEVHHVGDVFDRSSKPPLRLRPGD